MPTDCTGQREVYAHVQSLWWQGSHTPPDFFPSPVPLPSKTEASYADLGPAYDLNPLRNWRQRELRALLAFAGVPAAAVSAVAAYAAGLVSQGQSQALAKGKSQTKSVASQSKTQTLVAGQQQPRRHKYTQTGRPDLPPQAPTPSRTAPAMPPKSALMPTGRNRKANRVVNLPVARSIAQRQATTKMVMAGDKLRIHRREYLFDVSSSTTFALKEAVMSPVVFPWAKQFSTLYETYKFLSLAYEYIPQTSTNAGGSVILAPDFDPGDRHAASEGKAEFLNMKGAVSGPLWNNLRCNLAASDLQKRKTLYLGLAGTGDDSAAKNDQRLHYAGRLWVGTIGAATYTNHGEIWVEYTVEFETPQLVAVKAGTSNDVGTTARASGTSNAAPFGTDFAEGTVPATFVSSGTTTSVTTFTFTAPWSGYVSVVLTTAAGVASITPSGTGDEAELSEGASSLTWFGWVDCDQDETFILTISNTDIASGDIYFMRGHDVRA